MGNENTVFTSTKLFMDARDGRLDSVRKGLKAAGFDLDAQDKDTGRTALCAACNNNLFEVVKLLLKKKINLDIQDMYGCTALHYASYSGYIDVTEQLLKKKPSLDLQDLDGHTALHCASVNGHSRIVLLLLQHGASAVLRNKYKLTAESIAKDEETRRIFSDYLVAPTALDLSSGPEPAEGGNEDENADS